MKTIEVLINIPPWNETPKYSIFITGEAKELGEWKVAVKMHFLYETFHGSELEMGAQDLRKGFRYQGSVNILNTRYQLLFGKSDLGDHVSVDKLITERNSNNQMIFRNVNTAVDNGYYRNDPNDSVMNAERIELTIDSFVPRRRLTPQTFLKSQCGQDIEKVSSIINSISLFSSSRAIDEQDELFEENEKVSASFDTGYGNALFISGNHELFSQNKYAYRMHNTSPKDWNIKLPPDVKSQNFKFYNGKWADGSVVSTDVLKENTAVKLLK